MSIRVAMPANARSSAQVRLSSVAWYLFPFAVLVAVWHLISASGVLPRIWLPSPLAVLAALQDLVASGQYVRSIESSLSKLLVGYCVSVVVGVSLGVLLGVRRSLADFVKPVISFFNALSGIVWIPLAILWFGLGTTTVTFIIWNSMFFLILFSTLLGVRSVPRVYENALLTMGASPWRVIRDVLVPGALPNIVTGLRLGMGVGWRALIAAEIFAAPTGLGQLIFNASYYFRTDVIFVGIITIGIIWLVTDRLVLVRFESWTIRRWGLVTT